MNHVSIFTGIGGFDLAAEWAGFNNVLMCEIAPYCQEVLRMRFPGVPIIGDVRDVGITAYANIERELQPQGSIKEFRRWVSNSNKQNGINPTLLTAGVPCQPASHAGKRRGKADDRWLWPQAIRVLAELQPAWAVFENPVGIGSLGELGGISEVGSEAVEEMGDWEAAELDNIISDIEKNGYEVQAVSIPACAVQAPHNRQRIFIVAHATELTTREQADEFADITEKWEAWESVGWSYSPSPHADRQGLEGHRGNGERAGEWFTGAEDWQRDWTEVAADLCRVDARLSAGVERLKLSASKHRENRIKALGNSVNPYQVYPILKAIADIQWGSLVNKEE